MIRPEEFDERFPGPGLAPEVWTTSYLPAWSSRAAAAAHYTLEADHLARTPSVHRSATRSTPRGPILGP